MRLGLFAVALSLGLVGSAYAQVHKCTTAGKVEYSDKPCVGEKRTTIDYIHATPTAADLKRQREFARQQAAHEAINARAFAIDAQRQQMQQAQQPVYQQPAAYPPDHMNSAAAIQAMREREAAALAAKQAASAARDVERAAMRAAAPAIITNCDSAGCWDTNGQRYNNGAGNTVFRSDGRVCQMVGTMLQCN